MTNKFKLLFLFAALSSCASLTSSIKKYSREDFYESTWFRNSELSKDGKILFTSYGPAKLWAYNLESHESSIVYSFETHLRAWNSSNYISSIERTTDGKYLIIGVAQRGKNASKGDFEIFKYDIENQQSKSILTNKSYGLEVCGLSPDGSKLSYMLKSKNKETAGIFVIELNLADPNNVLAPTEIVTDKSVISCGNFSEDNKEYFYSRYITNSTSELVRVDIQTKQEFIISPNGKYDIDLLPFTKTDPRLFVLSNYKSDFKNIYIYNFFTKELEQKTFENGDVTQVLHAHKHGLLFYIINEDGFRKLKIMTSYFKPVQNVNVDFDLFSMVAVDDAEENFVIRAARSPFPFELYLYNWKSGLLTQLTKFNKLQVPDVALVKPELVHIKSTDGLQFSSWLMRPKPELDNGIAIINVHGGPEASVTQSYDDNSQYLVNQGFTLIQPNFRGSTGYGKNFQRKIYRDWGGGHIQDIMATHRYLVDQLKVNDKKIAVVGGSFGGYTSAEIITQFPKSFCAASTEYAVFDIPQLIKDKPKVYQKSYFETVGHPDIDLEKLNKASPMFKIDSIQTPMLVVYGEEDKIVLKEQSEIFITKMAEKNKKYEVIVYDNEGHGIQGYSNFLYYQKELPNFLEKHCR